MSGTPTHTRTEPGAIERTLPAPWEREETFAEVLHEWWHRSPAVAVSVVAHLVVLMLVAAIPWNAFEQPEETTFHVSNEVLPDPPPEEPPPEIVPPIEPLPTPVEPIPVPEVLSDVTGEDDPDAAANLNGNDSDRDVDSRVVAIGQPVVGIGGGPLGSKKIGNRNPSGGQDGRGSYGPYVERGLAWLAAHQNEDGSWDVDGFDARHACACDGHGSAGQDVGVTALALLAFTGRGYTPQQGPYKQVTARAMNWLREQQDLETGRIGEDLGHAFLYDHGLATLALCDLYLMTRLPMLKRPCQKAVNYIGRARNPYGAWRYEVPPTGDNDSSVTGWMVFALSTAQDAGLKVDREALTGALTWFDEVTDPATGRTGYDRIGSVSSRIENVNDHYAADQSEGMTAVALLCRFFLGQDPETTPVMRQQADLVAKRPPVWEPDAHACDMYAWYYATYAMFQMGGRHWKAWERSLGPAIARSQRTDGHFEGSWDPVGPWGFSGGRVYSTALLTLCLEVEHRYARVR